jgi:hypothetical protein
VGLSKKMLKNYIGLISLITTLNVYGRNSYGHSTLFENFGVILIILFIVSIVTFIGYKFNNSSDKFFTENHIVDGIFIITFCSVIVVFVLEVINGDFGLGTILVSTYIFIYFLTKPKNNEKNKIEIKKKIEKYTENHIEQKKIISCPNCYSKYRVPINKKIEVSCKKCQNKWVITT